MTDDTISAFLLNNIFFTSGSEVYSSSAALGTGTGFWNEDCP
jgi:hypothetical protein